MGITAVTSRDDRAVQLLKKLGVNTSEATRCSIVFEPDSYVTLRVDYRLSFDNLAVLEENLKLDVEK